MVQGKRKFIDSETVPFTTSHASCYAKPAKKPRRYDPEREMVCSSLQCSVSVRSRAEVIITHAPSTLDACETRMHNQ